MKSDVRVLRAEPFFTDEVCRTPIKFGNVVMDRATYCRVRVTAETRGGTRATGWGGMFLADFWGFPSQKVSHPDRDRAMREVVLAFAKAAEADGRQFFPQASADVAKVHPDLFRVRDGKVRTESMTGSGFGFRMEEIA